MSEKLPKKVRVLIGGVLFSSIGNGMVLPYFFLYLHSVRGIDAWIAGGVAGFGALISLLVSPLMGNAIDHFGPKPILMASCAVSGIGYASLAYIHHASFALLSVAILSIGQSGMWPAQRSIQGELTPEHLRERMFGASFAALNIGIAIGGLVASLIVDLHNSRTFELLYLLDGASFFGYIASVAWIGKVGQRSAAEKKINSERTDGWREVLADKTFVKFWFVTLFAILFGYAQLEVGIGSFAVLVAKMKPSEMAYPLAVNTILIGAFQLYFVKRFEKVKRANALAIAATLWALSWVAASFAGFNTHWALASMVICQLIFATGEMVWSPIIPSVTNQLAPEHLRGRYNAASGNSWQIGMIAGPIFAGTLLGAGLHWLWLGSMIFGLLTVSFFALRLKLPDRVIHG